MTAPRLIEGPAGAALDEVAGQQEQGDGHDDEDAVDPQGLGDAAGVGERHPRRGDHLGGAAVGLLAVGAAGERFELQHEGGEDVGDGEGDDGEVEAAYA